MHELPITKSILDWACIYAQKAQARKVVTIILQLGVLRDLQKDWLQRYFRYLSKDTIAAEAEILVIEVPLTCKCLECGDTFPVDTGRLADETILCPSCHSRRYEIVTGTEFMIQGIEVI
jgi:hydrogenase nickel incorporation protein HypA/HybF